MYRIRPMPVKAGFLRLSGLRYSINTLGNMEAEKQENNAGLDFPSFNLPPLPASHERQAVRKPAPIDLRMRVDLRDVRLYVDVIVDMLLQSLDGHAYPSGLPQTGGFARKLGTNPEARRMLEKLLDRAEKLKAGKDLSTEEIIRALTDERSPSGEALLKLPLSLKNIAVTRERSANQSRLGRRERLVREARRLVMAQFPVFGRGAEIITKQKDDGSALHVVVPHAEPVYGDRNKRDGGEKYAAKQEAPAEKVAEHKPENAVDANRKFAPPRVEYLKNYRRESENESIELLKKYVDANTLSQLSGEAAVNLNRMLEQGKLVPSDRLKSSFARTETADAVMTYASLYGDAAKTKKPEREYNIIVKSLYYSERLPEAGSIKPAVLAEAGLRHIDFGRNVGSVSIGKPVVERRISDSKSAIQLRAAVSEQSGTGGQAMFFAESPVASAAAGIEARQTTEQQAQPVYAEPDMTKLKNEMAKQAGKELDEIIKKKLNVDTLTDKIYRNLENRLRSERIRRGIV